MHLVGEVGEGVPPPVGEVLMDGLACTTEPSGSAKAIEAGPFTTSTPGPVQQQSGAAVMAVASESGGQPQHQPKQVTHIPEGHFLLGDTVTTMTTKEDFDNYGMVVLSGVHHYVVLIDDSNVVDV